MQRSNGRQQQQQLIMEKNPVLQNFLAIGTVLKLSFSERL
jgi:hypothetical protein